MIYLFIWEKKHRLKTLNTWKKVFKEKYDENNIFHIQNPYEYNQGMYQQILFSWWLFSKKVFCIIDDIFAVWDEKKDPDSLNLQKYFLEAIQNISTDTTLVFNTQAVDKRSSFYKLVSTLGEVKDFTISNKDELLNMLKKDYQDKVSYKALEKLIEMKWVNFWVISGELEKLLITHEYVDTDQLWYITIDIEESIFLIVDDILNQKTPQALEKMKKLFFQVDDGFRFYHMLLSNLRIFAYIFLLKSYWVSQSDIKNRLSLGNRGFLVDKRYSYDLEKFLLLYQNMAGIDSLIKTWKLLWTQKEDILFEIEKNLLTY